LKVTGGSINRSKSKFSINYFVHIKIVLNSAISQLRPLLHKTGRNRPSLPLISGITAEARWIIQPKGAHGGPVRVSIVPVILYKLQPFSTLLLLHR